jgi:predicted nucleic acid-binding protein
LKKVDGSRLVLVDTSIWVDFLANPQSAVDSELDGLMARAEAAVTGIVLVEVLNGARSKEEFQYLGELLNGLPFLDTTQRVWRRVSELAFSVKARGQTMTMPALVIGAVALEYECLLFTTDKAFSRVPALSFHRMR